MLVASDFDGTLAEIVPRPEAAAPLPEAVAILSRLAHHPAVRVAIVSGRSLADLRARCPIPGSWYVGGHGIESAAPEGHLDELTATPTGVGYYPDLRRRLAAIGDDLRRQLPHWPGTEIEAKPYSIAVHFRRAPEWAPVAREYFTRVAAGGGFRVLMGRQVVELLPENALTKGHAVERLRSRLRCDLGFYFGDDVTDEDVFRLDDRSIIGVKVRSAERSAQPSAAAYAVDSPAAVVEAMAAIGRFFLATARNSFGFSTV